MSYFLSPANSLKRTINEWQKYEEFIVAVDFDSTLKPWHDFEGEECDAICELVKDLKSVLGCYLILFTANKYPEECVEWCKKRGIIFDSVNDNSPVGWEYFVKNEYPEPPRKIYFNALLDDKAGLAQVYNELKTLVDLVKSGVISKEQIKV